MEFGKALENAKLGNSIARKGWNGKNMYVTVRTTPMEGLYIDGEEAIMNPFLSIKNQDGSHSMWVASTGDLLAEDWYVVV